VTSAWSCTARALLATLVVAGCGHETTAPTATTLTAQNSTVGIPTGWSGFLGQPVSFAVGVETANVHGGANAAYLTNTASVASGTTFMTITQLLRPDHYAGHRVRLSGWLRSTNVVLPIAAAQAAGEPSPVSGIWMRIDGASSIVGLDNMSNRPVVGTTDWHQVSVVLDVPSDAAGIAFGVLFSGSGQLLADDLALDTVSVAVQTTNFLNAPRPTSDNSGTYLGAPLAPLNLDFETVSHALAVARASRNAGSNPVP
jgi:hypothetical protein